MKGRSRSLVVASTAVAAFAFLLGLAVWRVPQWQVERRERQLATLIRSAADRYQVEPALIQAVVWRESRFRAAARGKAGELGLMQVGPLAASEWAQAERRADFKHESLLDPGSNVLAGTWYLTRLRRRYLDTDYPEVYALADYNAGRANVLRWIQGEARTNSEAFLRTMDFPGTRHYIREILGRRAMYRARGAQ